MSSEGSETNESNKLDELYLTFTYKPSHQASVIPCDKRFYRQPTDTLKGSIEWIFENYFYWDYFKWFEFFDSEHRRISNFNLTVVDYIIQNKSNIIFYCTRVSVRFRDMKYLVRDNWCLHYQPKIDRIMVPEVGACLGFDSQLMVSEVLMRFKNHRDFCDQKMTFCDANGRDIANDLTIGNFVKENGPIIFFKFIPRENAEQFYISKSHDPHIPLKKISLTGAVTVDELSDEQYKQGNSKILNILYDDIVRFVPPNKDVRELLKSGEQIRLSDTFDNEDVDDFNVSVRFRNGGDLFIHPILARARNGQSIKSFVKNMLMKSTGMESTGISDHLNLLTIKMGNGVRLNKCSSNVKITKPNQPQDHPMPVYEINALHLPNNLKNCNYPTDFYFYDATNPLGRINNGYTKITGHGHKKLLKILTDFGSVKQIDIKNCNFFNSRGTPIEMSGMQSTVNEFAQFNETVIVYQNRD